MMNKKEVKKVVDKAIDNIHLDVTKELQDLLLEYGELKAEMETLPASSCYNEDNWNRKILLMRRIKILRTFL